MKRRQFLQYSGYGLAQAGFLFSNFPKIAFAQKQNPDAGFFLQIYIAGGWDVTLLSDAYSVTDTKKEDMFVEYRTDQIIQKSNLKLAPGLETLGSFLNDISVVNGIIMKKDIGHPALAHYMGSGRSDDKAPFLSLFLEKNDPTDGVGLIAVGEVDDKASVLITESNSIQEITNSFKNSNNNNQSLIEAIVAEEDSEAPLFQAKSGLKKLYEKHTKLIEIMDIKTSSNANVNSAKAVAAAFSLGLARRSFMNIQTNGSLDTHANHEGTHLKGLQERFEAIKEIFSLFKSVEYQGRSLFDQTTFMIFSEFSRTPNLNSSNGKDHNPYTNSVILAGRNINPNKVIGESKLYGNQETKSGQSLHIGLPIEYSSGKVISDSKRREKGVGLIYPEHVIQTVHAAVTGNSSHPYLDRKVSVLPGIIKK